MNKGKDQDTKKVLSLSGRGKLELKRPAGESAQVRQSFSHGRSKTVTVEVKRKRQADRPAPTGPADGGAAARRAAQGLPTAGKPGQASTRRLTDSEREARLKALKAIREREEEDAKQRAADAARAEAEAEAAAKAKAEADAAAAAEPQPEPEILDAEKLRQRELEELKRIQEQENAAAEEAEAKRKEEEAKRKQEESKRKAEEAKPAKQAKSTTTDAKPAQTTTTTATPATPAGRRPATREEEEESPARKRRSKGGETRQPAGRRSGDARRRTGKMTVVDALSDNDDVRTPSLASIRRARQKERARLLQQQDGPKITREVTIPEAITVQDLANRMAERAADVIKALMRMGVMATITQSIDADTAELLVTEFGHQPKRVADADVEIGLEGTADDDTDLRQRAPVVTVMGHVDHGKTSLLDAIRASDVAAKEAGGITQHIGAYQVTTPSENKITFIDTPGHAAFSEMRARGATVTDVVVLVVAADDGVMPQTVEAINHAKAAQVPIIVAVNKIDLPSANATRVKQELLQHDLVIEEMGGEILCVEVSAKSGQGLEELEETLALQAEILELKANPDRSAQAVVIEAKLERGRGSVATVLVQRGTLRVGDIFVTGSTWGRVRALINDREQQVESAGPAEPVEVLGLQGTPMAGDDFIVVENEARAREIAEFRDRKKRATVAAQQTRGSLEQMFDQFKAGSRKELAVVIKGDVHGSVEAIEGALSKIAQDNDEVSARVLHTGVGAINESDITLAKASDALVIGFNVRANPQARELARRDGVEIRYYSVIYDVIDDVRGLLSGMLAPTLRETFLGNAEIREVFNITKVGKVAGCMVTEGMVKRGAKVRLLRDNVVIHEGTLKTLKRFKDEVREVREGFECGMAFENYDDIRQNDVIEAFEVEEVAAEL